MKAKQAMIAIEAAIIAPSLMTILYSNSIISCQNLQQNLCENPTLLEGRIPDADLGCECWRANRISVQRHFLSGSAATAGTFVVAFYRCVTARDRPHVATSPAAKYKSAAVTKVARRPKDAATPTPNIGATARAPELIELSSPYTAPSSPN